MLELKRWRIEAKEPTSKVMVAHANVALHSGLKKFTEEDIGTQVLEKEMLKESLASNGDDPLLLMAEQTVLNKTEGCVFEISERRQRYRMQGSIVGRG